MQRKLLEKIKLAFFFWFFLQGAPCFAQDVLLREWVGQWVNRAFLKAIFESRSPQKAVKIYSYPEVEIQQNGLIFQLFITEKFQKRSAFGIERMEEIQTGKIWRLNIEPLVAGFAPGILIEKRGESTYLKLLIASNGENASDKPSSQISIEYQKVIPSTAYVINAAVLEGDYQDADGRRFFFRRDFTADWPGKHFRYRIGLEVAASGFDCLDEVDGDGKLLKRFVFHWTQDILQIREMSFDPKEGYKPGALIYELQPIEYKKLNDSCYS
jgi:hypothetical protein